VFERRAQPRISEAIRVRWQRLESEGREAAKVGPVVASVTRDVSDGGLSFAVESELPVGTVLALELEREFGGPPLSALARVARCVRDAAGLFVGVQFTWIEDARPDPAIGLAPENAWTLL
jgi:hypothetical protein